MKIIQLIQKPQLRGAEIFASQLSEQLNKQGHAVILVSVFLGSSSLPFRGRHVELNRPLGKRLFDFRGWKEFADLVKKEQPDIIQANAGDTLKFAVLSRLLFRWKGKLVFRNANKMGDFITSKSKFVLNSFFVKRIDFTISVSELCRQDFMDTFRFPSKKTKTIPIGIDEAVVPDSVPVDLIPVFKDSKILVNAGSLVKEKNHAALLRIFKRVSSRNPQLKLLIMGKGPLKPDLEKYCRELQLESSVYLLGERTDVLQIVKQAKLFLMPSLIEGLPGVILEAFYCGTPVIANDVGGVSEIVSNGSTGILIEKNDEEAFARAIESLLTDNVLRTELANNALRLVRSRYKNESIAREFAHAYSTLL